MWRSKKNILTIAALAAIVLFALLTRFGALAQPYHHDEYKWALAADVSYEMTDSIPHPFLARAVYEVVGSGIGYEHLRLVPIVISFAVLALLFVYTRRRFGIGAGLSAVGVYVFSAYGILGSVQIDIDGAFLPLFTLMAFLGYELLLDAKTKKARMLALALLGGATVLGFSAKLAFLLVPVTLIGHYLLTRPGVGDLIKKHMRALVVAGGVAALLLGLMFIFWEQIYFFRYVDNFTSFSGRDYVQVLFQCVKAALYLSPVVLGLVLGVRHARDLSLWFVFLGANIAFYFVLFDFTHRTFDRYLLFIVLPMAVILGVTFARAYERVAQGLQKHFLTMLAASGILAFVITQVLATLPHRVIPLIPKTAFIESFLSLRLDFLLPMTGGSGPVGYYLPVDALLLLWGFALLALFLCFVGTERVRTYALAVFIGVSFAHTALVTHEYLTGARYGYLPQVVQELLAEIKNQDLGPILTYNDIGAYELHEMGKYGARFYPHTEFVASNIEKLKAHEGEFLVVGLPLIAPDSVYGRFFASCGILAEASDGVIAGKVLNCQNAKEALVSP
jgi:hypothetical protein